MSTAFFFDERCLWHSTGLAAGVFPVGGWVQPPSGAGHAESPDSKRRLKSLMDVSGLTSRLDVRSARPATRGEILAVHEEAYIDALKAMSDSGGGDAGQNAPFGPGSFEIASLSAGLAIEAVDSVVSGDFANAYALTRPPGHHCLRNLGMGFCLLANIPIAIEAAIARRKLTRIAVIDWDVHHGNGTEAIFYDRADVLTISLHQEHCFPPGPCGLAAHRGTGPGQGFNLNIPLPAGAGEAAYLHALEAIVGPAVAEYRPELIVVANGMDANALDPLARMLLSAESFRKMTEFVKDLAAGLCDGRLVMIHEGGYSEAYVPFCGHAVVESLAGCDTEVVDPMRELFELQQPGEAATRFHRSWIDDLRRELGVG